MILGNLREGRKKSRREGRRKGGKEGRRKGGKEGEMEGGKEEMEEWMEKGLCKILKMNAGRTEKDKRERKNLHLVRWR